MIQEKKPLSLRAKITILTLTGIIISVLLVGCVSIYIIRREKEVDNARQMNLLCDDYALIIDEFLLSVEQSVDMVARYAIEDLDSVALMNGGVIGAKGDGSFTGKSKATPEQAQALDKYLRKHVDRVCSVYRSVANHAQGAVAFYYRVNPEITIDAVGHLYSRKGHAGFEEIPLTDLSAYDPDDNEHVGWYYIPLRSGRPVWLLPYHNLNLEERMVSYVVPIYKAGTFIGVIGMDIGYQTIADLINQVELFESGYAFLTTDTGELIYHPTLPYEEMMKTFTPADSPIMPFLSGEEAGDDKITVYTYEGKTKAMVYHTLANGLRLVVVAPIDEINAQWRNLISTILILSAVILIVFVFITAVFTRRITIPLQRLTDASRELIAGNYDVDLPYNQRDEVGILTEAFRRLTQHLKIYISDLNGRAYSDALTGIKNKGAFDIFVRKLDDGIRTRGADTSFAMVMLDCNELKEINDTCGHDKGDIYLKNACRMICATFLHSPVFRVGGDEFVVLLQGEDYSRRDELMQAFAEKCEAANRENTERWKQVNLSKGIAVFEPGVDENTQAVLARADAKMYEEKRAYKEKRSCEEKK
ncbi:MAG TPA: hypothetical protein DHV42_04230 [Lachnospiraceae bacterium]|nr:hypothetical protein [Lachnospiraceae bacterium]